LPLWHHGRDLRCWDAGGFCISEIPRAEREEVLPWLFRSVDADRPTSRLPTSRRPTWWIGLRRRRPARAVCCTCAVSPRSAAPLAIVIVTGVPTRSVAPPGDPVDAWRRRR